jgi:hypothetical protein
VRPELEQQILTRWPDWFLSRGDVKSSLMGFGFQHGDGWFQLLVETLERIEPEVELWNRELSASGARFEIVEVKQKFGELRIIGMPTNAAIFKAFLDAQQRSRTICENCGAPGRLLEDGWFQTLCQSCANHGPL